MQILLPWVLTSLSVALLLGAGGLALLRRRRRRKPALPTEWPLTPRPVFSSSERRVYRQLREALPQHVLLAKLPVVRFCQPTDPKKVRFWYELLGSTHVSFAICSTNGRVLAAIDLESNRGSSPRSLQIKQSVLAACGVRYLRCTVDQLPSVPELQQLVPKTDALSPGQPKTPEGIHLRAGTSPRELATRWHESRLRHDTFFGFDNQGDIGARGSFGSLGGAPASGETPAAANMHGGAVVDDTQTSALRH